MLLHSFDRFHVVAKFELAKVEDLRFTTADLTLNVVIWLAMVYHRYVTNNNVRHALSCY